MTLTYEPTPRKARPTMNASDHFATMPDRRAGYVRSALATDWLAVPTPAPIPRKRGILARLLNRKA